MYCIYLHFIKSSFQGGLYQPYNINIISNYFNDKIPLLILQCCLDTTSLPSIYLFCHLKRVIKNTYQESTRIGCKKALRISLIFPLLVCLFTNTFCCKWHCIFVIIPIFQFLFRPLICISLVHLIMVSGER